ncbi:MAG: aldo/keto reductase [Opitutaceae bacterium]|nr:aldo/keto reductase [Opitutaceae bacterium]
MTDRLDSLPLPVSKLALGTWAMAGGQLWGPQDEADSHATVHAALDAGITLIDTAPGYGGGLSEEVLGRALKGRRDRALIATKIGSGDLEPAKVTASCEASLRRLQTDCIDLLQIHWFRAGAPLEDVIAAMENLRAAGKVRALGVSNFGPRQIARVQAAGTGWATNQLCYNLLWRAIEFEIVDACAQSGLGILCYSPLQQGLLAGRFKSAAEVPEGRNRTRHFRSDKELSNHDESGHEELTFATIERIRRIAADLGCPMGDLALAWLLHRPGVTSVLFGARNPAQVAANLAAASLKLDGATLAALNAATAELKAALGPNADLWNSASRIE